MWFRVQAETRAGRETKFVDINVHNEKEALHYGRVWFPEDQFMDHKLVPVPEKESTGAARQ